MKTFNQYRSTNRGNFKVVRDCCTSGMCFECHAAGRQKPARVMQSAGYSERYARFVAANWKAYNAAAVPS